MSHPPPPETPSFLVKISRDIARQAIAFSILVAFAIAANFSSAAYVAWSIDRLAAGRPSCMVKAIGEFSGYRPVARLMDLTALSLRATSGFEGLTWHFHGVLLVDVGGERPLGYNWSWSRLAFEHLPAEQYNMAIWPPFDACIPEPGFGTRLLFG